LANTKAIGPERTPGARKTVLPRFAHADLTHVLRPSSVRGDRSFGGSTTARTRTSHRHVPIVRSAAQHTDDESQSEITVRRSLLLLLLLLLLRAAALVRAPYGETDGSTSEGERKKMKK
jgi:hypothetical protein